MSKPSDTRVTCCLSPHGVKPGVYFANVWGPRKYGFCPLLGHGEGPTRAEAIKAARASVGRGTPVGRGLLRVEVSS